MANQYKVDTIVKDTVNGELFRILTHSISYINSKRADGYTLCDVKTQTKHFSITLWEYEPIETKYLTIDKTANILYSCK